MESRLNENEADGPYTRTTSPDGKYVWLADPYEVRMSHYIFVGELWQKSPAAILLKPADGWSFEQREWTSATRLQLQGRRYPGSRAGIVATDQRQRTAPSCAGIPLCGLTPRCCAFSQRLGGRTTARYPRRANFSWGMS